MQYPDVIASAKALTDQTDSDQGGTEAEHIAWLQEDYPAVVREMAKIVPDWYTHAVTGTLSSSPSSPVGAFNQVRKVERLSGDTYVLVPPADYNHVTSGRICWRQIGQNVEILPESVTGLTLRVEYIPAHPLPASNIDLALPPGTEPILVHMLASRIRNRLDQDTRWHDKEVERLWAKARASLVPPGSMPRVISEYSADESEAEFIT